MNRVVVNQSDTGQSVHTTRATLSLIANTFPSARLSGEFAGKTDNNIEWVIRHMRYVLNIPWRGTNARLDFYPGMTKWAAGTIIGWLKTYKWGRWFALTGR